MLTVGRNILHSYSVMWNTNQPASGSRSPAPLDRGLTGDTAPGEASRRLGALPPMLARRPLGVRSHTAPGEASRRPRVLAPMLARRPLGVRSHPVLTAPCSWGSAPPTTKLEGMAHQARANCIVRRASALGSAPGMYAPDPCFQAGVVASTGLLACRPAAPPTAIPSTSARARLPRPRLGPTFVGFPMRGWLGARPAGRPIAPAAHSGNNGNCSCEKLMEGAR
jgi:hypothetical protein